LAVSKGLVDLSDMSWRQRSLLLNCTVTTAESGVDLDWQDEALAVFENFIFYGGCKDSTVMVREKKKA